MDGTWSAVREIHPDIAATRKLRQDVFMPSCISMPVPAHLANPLPCLPRYPAVNVILFLFAGTALEHSGTLARFLISK